MARVFVSSTCYDLVDVRAELKALLEDMGFDAQLSEDDLDSAFEVSGDIDKTSIQECLDNVNTCDCFLLILSQRYGPSLAKAGYPDVSATHLEYQELVRRKEKGEKVKLFVYVRDRLAQDFSNWRANGRQPMKHSWVQEKDAARLFAFLDEVVRLNAHEGKDGTNNWYTRFRDSAALKDLVRRHLNALSPEALLARLVRDKRMAMVGISAAKPAPKHQNTIPVAATLLKSDGRKPGDDYHAYAKFAVNNFGDVAAMNLRVTVEHERDFGVYRVSPSLSVNALAAGAEAELIVEITAKLQSGIAPGDKHRVPVRCRFEYKLPTGEVIQDTSEAGIEFTAVSSHGKGNLPPEVTELRFQPSNRSEFIEKQLVRVA